MTAATSGNFLVDAWKVLVIFLIPFGGGIPGGVLLARDKGIDWPFIMFIYFVSDLILACLFEPILKLLSIVGKNVQWMLKFSELFKLSVQKTIAYYGNRTNPVALILIAFGVDPMTGRAAAIAAGHGFVGGWLIAIAGDMIYFTLIMACTLWLSHILGDGTVTMFVILAVMLILPMLIRRVRKKKNRLTP
ncbi:MAG: hypothetical protein R3A80_04765 [Bdellovibrionota bacterium]